MKGTATILFILLSIQGFAQDLKATDTEALVTFVVTDYATVPEEGAVVVLETADKSFSRRGVANIDGKYVTLLPEGKTYKLSVIKFGETFDFETMAIPSMAGAINFEQKLKIRIVTNYVRSYTLENVYFDTNKWDMKSQSMPAVNKLHQAMTSNPKMKVEIAGHTDNVGDDKSNMQLSQKRSNTIVEYLVGKGINKDRLVSKGYGEVQPIASNDSEDGRAKNRRTEVKVISE